MADNNRPGDPKPILRAAGQNLPQSSPRRSSRLLGRATSASASDDYDPTRSMDLMEVGKRLRQMRSERQKQVAFTDSPRTKEQGQGPAPAAIDPAFEYRSADSGESSAGQRPPALHPLAQAIYDYDGLDHSQPAATDSNIECPVSPSTRTGGSPVSNKGKERADGSHLTSRRAARIQQLFAHEQALRSEESNAGAKRRFDERDDGDRPHDHHQQHRHQHQNHHRHAGGSRPDVAADGADNTAKRMRDDRGNSRPVVHELPSNATVHMLSQIWDAPHALSIGQISSMFELIQGRVWGGPLNPEKGFVQKHFAFVLNAAQCAAWPLHELKTKHLALYMSAMYLADGSQYGWRNFFTQPQFRQYLVGAILGEWFTQRIFKHTAFGLPVDLVDELEEIDREYLQFDAVVRSKKRAEFLNKRYQNPANRPVILDSVKNAASNLADELLVVLQPLLPPPVFDSTDPLAGLCKTNPVRIQAEKVRCSMHSLIKKDLENLIRDCAALHMGIRFAGQDGTIVRFVPHLQKGSRFHPTAPMLCLNEDWCNQTVPAHRSEKSELCVKMTCWPRVEAIVPHGPDMDDLGFREREYRKEKLLRAGHDIRRPDILSEDNCDTDAPEYQFTWDGHDGLWPVLPEELQDDEGRQAQQGKVTDEQGRKNTEKRAAYMTVYACISPSMVYCEWTPQPRARGQSLSEAVLEARRTATGSALRKYRVEDLQIDLWNTWALYGGLAQWGVITAGLLITISRYFHIPSHVRNVLLKTFHGTKQVTTAGSVRGSKVVASSFRHTWKSFGPFGAALAGPMNTLIVEPLEHLLSLVNRNAESAGSASGDFASSNSSSLPTMTDGLGNDIEKIIELSATLVTASLAATTSDLPDALTSITPEPNALFPTPDVTTAATIVDVTQSAEFGPLDADGEGASNFEEGEPLDAGKEATGQKSPKSWTQTLRESMNQIGDQVIAGA